MATSCILSAINSILAQARAIPYDWTNVADAERSRPTFLFQKTAVWNNQVRKMLDGSGVFYESPSCFLEMRPEKSMQMADNITVTDVCWKIHIVHGQLDAGDDENMDQNLMVFQLRDLVKSEFVGFEPESCSTMFCEDEEQDYDHGNIYHYILSFKSCLKDTKGSMYDPDQTRFIYSTPPTNLELQTGFTEAGEPPVDPMISYIWKVCEVRAELVATPNPLITQTLANGVTIPLQYAVNDDGTFTMPYLASTPGINLALPFLIGNQNYDVLLGDGGVLDNSAGGGFAVGDTMIFNANLPLGVGA
jgi:hypothetical protein